MQWPTNAQSALQQLRPLADTGDTAASIVVAWLYLQVGPWNEGIPYALRAADAGVAPVLNGYIGNMLGDASMHADMLRFVRVQLDAGWPVDPIGWVPQLLQQGHRDTAVELLKLGLQKAPAGARQQWDELVASTSAAADVVRSTASDVKVDADRSLESMRADKERVDQERERVERLVAEVASLANEGASLHLAKEYAAQATKEEKTADTHTRQSGGPTTKDAQQPSPPS